MVTYTLQQESGSSLRGAGWKIVGEVKPQKNPWGSQNRARDWQPTVNLNLDGRHQMVHLDEAKHMNMSAEQLREELKRINDRVINFTPPKPTRQTRSYIRSSRGEEPTLHPEAGNDYFLVVGWSHKRGCNETCY